MLLHKLNPRKSLNKAFLKVKPNRTEIETFKAHLTQLIDQTNDTESEEFHKNLVSDFLKKTYYDRSTDGHNHSINTKGRNDLVIHNGNDAKSSVGVIIEAKKPTNKNEMITTENLNKKAFQELVLYYLRERITQKNLELKYLVATNIKDWFIFDATTFDRLFAQNKKLVKQFEDFEGGRLADTKTDFFYKQIAEPFIEQLDNTVEFTYFDLQDYDKPLRNDNPKDDTKLIALFKLLSPEHLLKLPFANDSNSLDKAFYSELLHIIGLEEVKDKGKKVIRRKGEGSRDGGSLLENAITIIHERYRLDNIDKPSRYGANMQEQQYNVALELCITWVNRILFLKLLESQLIAYHKNDEQYAFLNEKNIPNNDALDKLFFSVLAKKHEERTERIKEMFPNVPYLNSSLFEPTELERKVLEINQLDENVLLPVFSKTVLKNDAGKRITGEKSALIYLFEFLEAYDFSSEGAEEIQEDNKTLINASVLGLIFEKINGYKDGSFFTPGFITMYMCRETIRRSVMQKFNDAFKDLQGFENLTGLDDIYEAIGRKVITRQQANEVINSLKICDPAVGSGHFLVSALNEILAIKNDLKIIEDKNGKSLNRYEITVENDELVIVNEDGELFEYLHTSKEAQRVQETLFHEKQTIIENCLFGVDINPNSVKICRLRLWIELLKNAYYIQGEDLTGFRNLQGVEVLQTLPNIDINIKCGNSLISRFDLDADIHDALKKSKWNVETYRAAVHSYRNAQSKEEKREMERLIEAIKSDFRSEISKNDPKQKRLYKLSGELAKLTTQTGLFEMSKKEKTAWNKKVEKLTKDTKKLETEIEEIKNNQIYENAFEWRFEFPEVLNDEGDFVGFDTVIGNPPYVGLEKMKTFSKAIEGFGFRTFNKKGDIYTLFVELAFNILTVKGWSSYIMPNKWLQAGYGKGVRNLFLEKNLLRLTDFGDIQVFEEATTYPCIYIATNKKEDSDIQVKVFTDDEKLDFISLINSKYEMFKESEFDDGTWIISSRTEKKLLERLNSKGTSLEEYVNGQVNYGIKFGLTEAFLIDSQKRDELIQQDQSAEQLTAPVLRGRNIKKYQIPILENLDYIILAGYGSYKYLEKDYPSVYNHLCQYEGKLKKRGQCNGSSISDKKPYFGQHHWLELDNNPSTEYLDLFKGPKIMYQVFQVKPCFIYSDSSLYCNNSMWIIPTDDKSLLAILNSKFGWWLITKYCTQIQNGYQLIWKYFSQIPIASANENQSEIMTQKVDQILALKKENPESDTSALEAEIDRLVYDLYELTPEEIEIVENAVK